MTTTTQARELEREVEWRRCSRDPIYFLDNYWSIETLGKGYEVSGLREYQRADVTRMVGATTGDETPRQIRLKARQIGYTTIACGFAFWSAFFFPHHPWLVTQQSEDEAQKTLLTKVKLPYQRLPPWLRDRGPKLLTENMQEMVFENGSSMTAVHSGAAAARGRAVYGAIMDEGAFMEDAESLFGALDPLTYGPLFLFSTANGMGNFFHDIWLDSQLLDSEWSSGFHPWSVVPGRDETWFNRTKRRYRGREWLFFQEFPSSAAEAFARSGRTAFPIELLEEEHDWSLPEARYDITQLDIEFTGIPIEEQLMAALIPAGEDRDLELHVWEHPYTERADDGTLLRPPNFALGVDVSEGLEDGDYSAISVFDANSLEQVATVRSHVPVEDLGALTEWIGYWYYTALIGVERNNQGLVPLQHLTLNQYPRLYRMDTIASQKRGSRTPRYGWFTHRSPLSMDTPVLTPEGWDSIGAIKKGDWVIGSDGQRTRVTGVYPQGNRPALEVRLTTGSSFICDAEHLWPVQLKWNPKGHRVLATQDLMGDLDDKRWYIPRGAPPDLEPSLLPLDPYFLGLLLGDGSFGRSILFASADQEIVDWISAVLPPEMSVKGYAHYVYSLTGPRTGKRQNWLTSAVDDLGLRGKRSHEKFIPAPYLLGSPKDRLELLRGLMDTDGCATQSRAARFNSTSPMLADGVRTLVRSLGGSASVSFYENEHKGNYSVSVSTPDNPFRLSRKAELYSDVRRQRRDNIESITPLDGEREMVCISVEADDGLFVVEDYVLTHNTKPKMVIDFLKAIRSNTLTLRDSRFLVEARTFLADGSGAYGASSGNHDDLTLATLVAYQMCLDVGRYPIVWQDNSLQPVTMDDVLGLTFPKQQSTVGSSPMYRPLGQRARPTAGAVKSLWLHERNVG